MQLEELMSHVRVRFANQERWYHNVVSIAGDGRYVSLTLDAHPSLVHFFFGTGPGAISFLMGETAEDITALLRAERRGL